MRIIRKRPHARGRPVYPIEDMIIGESRRAVNVPYSNVYQCARQYGLRSDKKFQLETDGPDVIVTRVDPAVTLRKGPQAKYPYAKLAIGESCVIHGAAGNIIASARQFASRRNWYFSCRRLGDEHVQVTRLAETPDADNLNPLYRDLPLGGSIRLNVPEADRARVANAARQCAYRQGWRFSIRQIDTGLLIERTDQKGPVGGRKGADKYQLHTIPPGEWREYAGTVNALRQAAHRAEGRYKCRDLGTNRVMVQRIDEHGVEGMAPGEVRNVYTVEAAQVAAEKGMTVTKLSESVWCVEQVTFI